MTILAWLSYFSSRNDANLCWEQGLFVILCAALMGEAGRLQKWSNFPAVSLSLASSCCSHSNGFLQLSNVRSTEIMLYLGRNEKALQWQSAHTHTHTKKIVHKIKQSLLVQAVFSWGVPCSVWKGKVEEQVVGQEDLNIKIKLSLLFLVSNLKHSWRGGGSFWMKKKTWSSASEVIIFCACSALIHPRESPGPGGLIAQLCRWGCTGSGVPFTELISSPRS